MHARVNREATQAPITTRRRVSRVDYHRFLLPGSITHSLAFLTNFGGWRSGRGSVHVFRQFVSWALAAVNLRPDQTPSVLFLLGVPENYIWEVRVEMGQGAVCVCEQKSWPPGLIGKVSSDSPW